MRRPRFSIADGWLQNTKHAPIRNAYVLRQADTEGRPVPSEAVIMMARNPIPFRPFAVWRWRFAKSATADGNGGQRRMEFQRVSCSPSPTQLRSRARTNQVRRWPNTSTLAKKSTQAGGEQLQPEQERLRADDWFVQLVVNEADTVLLPFHIGYALNSAL